MKGIASLLALAAFAAAFTFGPSASAQQPAQQRATKTAEYTEQNVGGDQVVKFTGDELAGMQGGYYGDLIRPLPGVTRMGLIRPRMNFVSELLKSVENL
jgi:hypothetical protein